MSITDELREWAKTLTNWWYDPVKDEYTYTTGGMPTSIDAIRLDSNITAIADRIDAEHEAKVSYWQGASYKDGYDDGFASADDWLAQHEDAMAEHGWVRGPLDADGEMWHCGDMSDSNWGAIEGIAYENGRWLISGHDMSAPWIPADSIRHHHAPTVEDVLREFADEMNQNLGMYTGEAIDADEWRDADAKTVEKYAAKLRLAEGED